MELAKKFLVDEITYVRQIPKTRAEDEVTDSLRQMYKRKVTKEKEKTGAKKAAE